LLAQAPSGLLAQQCFPTGLLKIFYPLKMLEKMVAAM